MFGQVESVKNYSFLKDNIKTKSKLSYFFYYLIIGVLGFILGRAEVFSGYYPFSLIYWMGFALESPLVMIYITVVSGAGLAWNGDYLNLIYLLAGFSGVILSSFFKKGKDSIFFPVATGLCYLALSIVRGIIYQKPLYWFVITGIEALGIILVFLLLKGTRIHIFDKQGFVKASPVVLLITSLGFLVGIANIDFVPFFVLHTFIYLFVSGVAYISGFSYAVTVSVLYGLILSGLGLIPFVVMLRILIIGVITGLFKRKPKYMFIVGYFLTFLVYSGFSPGLYDLKEAGYGFGIALALYLVISESLWVQLLSGLKPSPSRVKKLKTDNELNKIFKQHLLELSRVFKELSVTFKEVLPDEEEEENLEDLAFILKNKVCQRCPRLKICWKKERADTYMKLSRLVEKARKAGKIEKPMFNNLFKDKCPFINKIIGGVKSSYEIYQVNKFWRERLDDKQRIVSEQLAGLSEIIQQFSQSSGIVLRDNPTLSHIYERAVNRGIDVYNLEVDTNIYSSRLNIVAEMEPCSDTRPCEEQLLPLISSEYQYNFRVINKKCGNKLKDIPCKLLYAPRGSYSLEYAVLQKASTGKISGDTYLFRPLRDGKDLIVLSDGMGVGKKAYQESKAAVNLLEKIIEAGFDRDLAIRTINSALYFRSQEESFTTLDIGFFDTFTGELIFNKIGAVSSFVKRGFEVLQIKASSLPVGILEKVEISTHSVNLKENDFVIMVTDGVLDSSPDIQDKEGWFMRILQNCSFDNPRELASYLMEVVTGAQGGVDDDLTIIVFKVNKFLEKKQEI
ncbi:SpoIIE family protein phosphatase [Halothermothrix orenii]|uniref:Serine/threonine specific protein phosphatase spoIIE n=1 Tax=Halothermothrix orenii (strain H 168 / OCM 544 / DSM 9562) TaxID=373903 RepID=B8D062_HALOH|nr:SpoIIE family protein phosphatase [Halothermothrix orenii]ACL68816.1 Serine/threonine specific protein phosphatase spoIIE [Halothermothrix orenii H 168]